jgi:hypothetical protein
MIVAIAVVVAAIVYFMLRKKKTASTLTTANLTATTPAPGVIPSTGQMPSQNVSKSSTAQNLASIAFGVPNPAVLSNVPIVGGVLAKVAAAPPTIATNVLNDASSILGHVPIVGGVLSAPTKVASKAISSVSHFFGF